MKQALSICMLLIMTVVSVHPTLAIHLCGGSLHSIDLLGASPEKCCCCGMAEHEAGKHQADCPEHNQSAPDNHTSAFSQPFGCCATHTVELSTDNYQVQQILKTGVLYPEITYIALFLSDPVSIWKDYLDPLTIQHIFPPGGLARYDADLLPLICIFRI